MSNETWWYIARSGGFVAWALSAISVLWGLLLTTRMLGKRVKAPRLLDLHRFLGGLSVVFVLIHMGGLYLHEYKQISFGLRELLVPGASKVTPEAVSYGVVAFYLLIAVEITSVLRRRVSQRVWRAVHYLSFVVLLLGSVHALKAGTDVQNPAIRWPAAIVCALIIGLGVARSVGRPLALGGGETAAPDEVRVSDRRDDFDFDLGGLAPPAADARVAPTGLSPYSRLDPAAAPSAPTESLGAPSRSRLAPQPATPRSFDAAPFEAPAPSFPAADPFPTAAPPAEPAPLRPAAETPPPPAVPVGQVAPRLTSTGLDRSILERARAGLEKLDTNAYPQAPVPAEMLTQRPEPTGEKPIESALPARSGDIAVRYAKLRQTGSGPAPAMPPTASLSGLRVPLAPPSQLARPVPSQQAAAAPPATAAPAPAPATDAPSGRSEWLRPLPGPGQAGPRRINWTGVETPDEPPAPTRSLPNDAPLPTRVPQRVAATTAPARSFTDWAPQRAEPSRRAGTAPPPPEPDPATGEVPPEAYRAWLREWLSFAETYDG